MRILTTLTATTVGLFSLLGLLLDHLPVVTPVGFDGAMMGGPLMSIKPGDKDICDTEGLRLIEWKQLKFSLSIGEVYYGERHGILKCTNDLSLSERELLITKSIIDISQHVDRNIAFGYNYLTHYITDVTCRRRKCIVSTFGGTKTLLEYSDHLPHSTRARQLPIILLNVMRGLVYLHELGITHYDFKPQNVILDVKVAGVPRPAIIDFDSAFPLEHNLTAWRNAYSTADTLVYRPPETVWSREGLLKRDSWAFGVMIVRLVTGQVPYGIERHYRDGVQDIVYETDQRNYQLMMVQLRRTKKHFYSTYMPSGELYKLYEPLLLMAERLLTINYKERPTLKELLLENLDRMQPNTLMKTLRAFTWP